MTLADSVVDSRTVRASVVGFKTMVVGARESVVGVSSASVGGKDVSSARSAIKCCARIRHSPDRLSRTNTNDPSRISGSSAGGAWD